jgi:hypothetical protein
MAAGMTAFAVTMSARLACQMTAIAVVNFCAQGIRIGSIQFFRTHARPMTACQSR